MDNELKTMLQSVIEEALKPVREDIRNVKQELQDTRSEMKTRFDNLDSELYLVKQDVAAIKASVARIEENEPADVIGTLRQINAKLDSQRDLVGKVDELETDIKLIKKAITNQ